VEEGEGSRRKEKEGKEGREEEGDANEDDCAAPPPPSINAKRRPWPAHLGRWLPGRGKVFYVKFNASNTPMFTSGW
jgi:hypothetical protein